MRVPEILKSEHIFLNQSISIEGYFVMAEGVGYIVDQQSEKEDISVSIGINVLGLAKLLYASVPAYGGTKFSYFDQAKIIGVLSNEKFGKFKLNLTDISYMEIEVSGEMFYPLPK